MIQLSDDRINSMSSVIISLKKLLAGITSQNVDAVALTIGTQLDFFTGIVIEATNQDPIVSNQELKSQIKIAETEKNNADSKVENLTAQIVALTGVQPNPASVIPPITQPILP